MRKKISVLTIPFLAPLILFTHAAYLDGNILCSLPVTFLASVIPLAGILLYAHLKATSWELREELKVRRAFMLSLGIAIMYMGVRYRKLGLDHLSFASLSYGFATFLSGFLTLLGHKSSVHTMARSACGFIELFINALLGVVMIGISILSGISRIKIDAHTKAQVISGFLIGPLSVIIFVIR